MKLKRKPNSLGYTNALLEDIKDQFKTVVEATEPIPRMQTTLEATFDEVGKLRIDMDVVKLSVQDINRRLDVMEKAMRLLERDTTEIDDLRSRVKKLERAINSR